MRVGGYAIKQQPLLLVELEAMKAAVRLIREGSYTRALTVLEERVQAYPVPPASDRLSFDELRAWNELLEIVPPQYRDLMFKPVLEVTVRTVARMRREAARGLHPDERDQLDTLARGLSVFGLILDPDTKSEDEEEEQ